MKQLAVAAMLGCLATSAWADWNLKPDQSSVHFISVKNGAVTEVHHFGQLNGAINAAGNASFSVDLASVETGIAIRNERMQKLLFDTVKFATADVAAQLDMSRFTGLKVGEFVDVEPALALSLHGVKKTLTVPCRVTALAGGGFQVVNRAPVVINAAEFGMQAGVQALQAVAKLNAIATQVPVSFQLVFEKQ